MYNKLVVAKHGYSEVRWFFVGWTLNSFLKLLPCNPVTSQYCTWNSCIAHKCKPVHSDRGYSIIILVIKNIRLYSVLSLLSKDSNARNFWHFSSWHLLIHICSHADRHWLYLYVHYAVVMHTRVITGCVCPQIERAIIFSIWVVPDPPYPVMPDDKLCRNKVY